MENSTLTGLLKQVAAEFPNRRALSVSGQFDLTHARLQDLVEQAAYRLVAAGVEPGEVVALTFPNTVELFAAEKMVSQRQRLARKRYKEANPEKFPKPEPTPPKDTNKKKKKKSNFKRKKSDSEGPSKANKTVSTHKKHPLRVPGMKPGESCFICKAQDHIAKNCPQKAQWERNKICLLCRQRGHSLKNCVNKTDQTLERKLCYNCGESGHSLAECPQPREDGGTKFANCFICNERGHLSKNCPQNTHGIYPKGGCCKICGGVTHLARDCPNKGNRSSSAANGFGKISTRIEDRPRGQVTKFISGDDLDDDFTAEDSHGGVKDKLSDFTLAPASGLKDNDVKPKKKQGPKVVDFVG